MTDQQPPMRRRDRVYGFAAAKYNQYYAGQRPADATGEDEAQGKGNRRGSHAPQFHNVVVSNTKAESYGQSFAAVNNLKFNLSDAHEAAHEQESKAIQEATAVIPLTTPARDRDGLISRKGRRVDSTCEWVLTTDQYQSWLTGEDPVLWICGDAGKGKTVLSLFLTEELEKTAATASDTQAIYYFCNYDDENRNKAKAVIRGLIHQLLEYDPDRSKSTMRAFFGHEKKLDQHLPNRETLWTIFINLLRHRKKVVCLIDGLDECDDDSKRWLAKKFIGLLDGKEAQSDSFTLQVILVSSEITDLRRLPTISMEAHEKEINDDIERAIRARLDQIGQKDLQGFTDKIRTEVESTLFGRSDEGFLWVGLVIEELLLKNSTTEIIHALHDFPPGVHALFRRSLNQVPSFKRKLLRSVVQWVALAAKPLTLTELGTATGIEGVPPNVSVEQSVRDELSTCDTVFICNTDEVHFKSRTVSEYLLEFKERDDSVVASFLVDRENASYRLAKECLKFVQDHLSERSMGKTEMQGVPMLEYSVYNWPYHAQGAGDLAKGLFTVFPDFFTKKSKLRKNWWATFKSDRKVPFPDMPRLHKACYLGLMFWIEDLREPKAVFKRMVPRTVSQRSGTFTLPITCAIAGGHTEVVRYLLEHGYGVRGRTPVTASAMPHTAAEYGHVDILRLLVKNNVRMDSVRPRKGKSVLHMAAASGHEEATRYLIEQGVSVHAWSWGRRTPLHDAAANGRGDAVLRLLLDEGANVNATAETYSYKRVDLMTTPLHEALLGKFEATVRLLLEYGADANADSGVPYTRPLYRALPNLTLVKLLVEKGKAKVNECPMIMHVLAAKYSHSETESLVEYLLEEGADLHVLDPFKWNALHMAVFSAATCHTADCESWDRMPRLYLDKGADPNWSSDRGTTMLIKLVKDVGRQRDNATAALAKLLIEYGADVTAKDNKRRTAFYYAKKYSLPGSMAVLEEHWPEGDTDLGLAKIDSMQSSSTGSPSIDGDESDDEHFSDALMHHEEILGEEWGPPGEVEGIEQEDSEEEILFDSDEED